MRTVTQASMSRDWIRGILIDIAALAFIYFVPALAHLLNFPVYMIEPMRLMLILSLAHSTKKNSYLLALTLPLFSFLVSSHPAFGKMLIVTAELTLNVFLFYFLLARMKNGFVAMLLAIIASKATCYLLYLAFFPVSFFLVEAAPLFLGVQAAVTLIFSGYVFIFHRKNRKIDP